jgi:hypothetical protein
VNGVWNPDVLNGAVGDWTESMVMVVEQLLVMLPVEESMYPTVVLEKAIEVGVPDSWQA